MSRPIIEQRNRAPQSAGYQRQRSAPGLDVAAPIVSNAPETNTFAELGRALGVATAIAATESNTKQSRLEAEYRQDQEEISLASAEADTWGNQIDPTKLAEDRIYARRVSALQGTRTALELSEKKATDFKEWRRENPLAPESKAREWLGEWDGIHLADDEGNPLTALDDPRQAAIIRSQIGATSFKLLTDDRDTYRGNVKEAGLEETSAALLSVNRQNGKLTAEDYANSASMMRSVGIDVDIVNKQLVSVAFAAADESGSSAPLEALPERWADGSIGPLSVPEFARTVEGKVEVMKAEAERKRIEGLADERIAFRLQADALADNGTDLTADQMRKGLELGLGEAYLASLPSRARNVREAAYATAAREAKEAGKLDEEYASLVSSPNSVNQGEAERIFGAKFDRMTDGQSRIAVVEQAVRTRGVLPSTYKNYLNRVPTSLKDFKVWRGSMSHMRALNEQVYASLGEQSRAAYEAWEAIRQTGRYTDDQLFVRIQSQDSKRGRELVGSKRGGEIVTEITDGSTAPLALSKARSLVETFGSFQDMTEEEALRLAKASYAATYFMHDGMMYHKSYAHSAGRIEKTKEEVAVALRSRGINVDPDDIVIAPIKDGSQFIVRERNSPRYLTNPLSADVIFRASQNRREQQLRKTYGEAPLGAARQGLDPTRIIPGETATERTRRIQMEQQAARDKR